MIRIVLIDDISMFLDGLKLLMDRIDDFKIVGEFANGQEFVNNIDNIDADIILTDIDMPEMDGIGLAKYIQATKPNLKVIGLSMYSDRKYYYEMVTAGARGFVLKQSPSKDLEIAIREVYNGGCFFSANLLRSVIIDMNNIEEKIKDDKIKLLDLSKRDINILELICKGLSNAEIAKRLYVSVSTIENSKTQLMKKTKAKNNAGLIIWSIKNNVVTI